MNDRFKFRLWDEETKQYHYDDFVVTSTGYVAKVEDDKSLQKTYINQTDFVFDKKTLEQCTGLKDKNENLIYEGDIIRVDDCYNCHVFWASENSRFEVSGYGEIAYLNYNDIEVIGNINKNIDMLKNPREIELEKKLEIAVKALEYYAKADWWNDAIDDDDNLYKKGAFENYGYLQAQQALKEIV